MSKTPEEVVAPDGPISSYRRFVKKSIIQQFNKTIELLNLFPYLSLKEVMAKQDKRAFKDKLYTQLASLARSMANPRRMEIIELLAQGAFSVEKIATETQLSIANASQHLQVLKAAHLVEAQRHGNFIYYRLANDDVFKAWKALRTLGAERNANVEKVVRDYRNAADGHEPVTIGELIKRLKSGKVTLVDVRPEHEYNHGHIASAKSMPINELAKRLKELPRRSEIVVYCRGPFCFFADEAVAILTRAGYKARRMEEGYPDWLTKGLPVEVNRAN